MLLDTITNVDDEDVEGDVVDAFIISPFLFSIMIITTMKYE